ncbi:hypothetical protein CRG98_041216 [Punica granatum]|uniref:Uncharacterized protein n=1 Tax=Punica granatum TaxID=22663 RepID=A0A2I0I3V3_PUNGR|nr:hypothetical protein CRG98_041216 [Punica granatum]
MQQCRPTGGQLVAAGGPLGPSSCCCRHQAASVTWLPVIWGGRRDRGRSCLCLQEQRLCDRSWGRGAALICHQLVGAGARGGRRATSAWCSRWSSCCPHWCGPPELASLVGKNFPVAYRQFIGGISREN